MCYLLTYTHASSDPPEQMEEFKTRTDAEKRGNALVNVEVVSEIRLWKFAGKPIVKQHVEWEEAK